MKKYYDVPHSFFCLTKGGGALWSSDEIRALGFTEEAYEKAPLFLRLKNGAQLFLNKEPNELLTEKHE